MRTFRFLQCVQRSLRMNRNPGICRNLQWQKAFSTNLFLLYHKRTEYYPTDKIKNFEDFEKYASPEEKDRLEFIRSEFIDYCRAGKFQILEPTDEDWLKCLNFETKSSRLSYLKQCEKKIMEKVKAAEKLKEPSRKVERDNRLDPDGQHRFIRAMFDHTVNMIADHRMARAALFEDPIVVDFSFIDSLYYHEIRDVALQLMYVRSLAKMSAFERTPTLNLIFCNVQKPWEENQIFKVLESRNQKLEDIAKGPVTITEKSYLDLFPKEDLVYLSPDARHYFHPDDGIPIIGGIIDTTTTAKLSYGKAKKEDLKIRKLPIDMVTKVYGNKCLALDHVVNYINVLRFTGDPYQAYNVLPLRKRRPPKKLQTP